MEIYYIVGGLGLISGFLAGLLGIGGGIVMASVNLASYGIDHAPSSNLLLLL
jgi:uncharacterized membrane protein YfcA